eukprot:scaffold70355_cov65-Attheya_sp.AAC.1
MSSPDGRIIGHILGPSHSTNEERGGGGGAIRNGRAVRGGHDEGTQYKQLILCHGVHFIVALRVFGVPSLVSLFKNGGDAVGASGGVNCWLEVWREDGSGGMGVTTVVGSGLGGNGGGGGISGEGVEGCNRGIIVQSITATRCGNGCRRSA